MREDPDPLAAILAPLLDTVGMTGLCLPLGALRDVDEETRTLALLWAIDVEQHLSDPDAEADPPPLLPEELHREFPPLPRLELAGERQGAMPT